MGLDVKGTVWAIASDHAGFLLKQSLVDFLNQKQCTVLDLGTEGEEAADYPDYARSLASAIKHKKAGAGVLLCGTGIGMSISVNRYPFIRGALCRTVEDAIFSRQHNDANVIIFGGRTTKKEECFAMMTAFMSHSFAGERHKRRVEKMCNDTYLEGL
jgi:ribose 5-phosphate isomerase B